MTAFIFITMTRVRLWEVLGFPCNCMDFHEMTPNQSFKPILKMVFQLKCNVLIDDDLLVFNDIIYIHGILKIGVNKVYGGFEHILQNVDELTRNDLKTSINSKCIFIDSNIVLSLNMCRNLQQSMFLYY